MLTLFIVIGEQVGETEKSAYTWPLLLMLKIEAGTWGILELVRHSYRNDFLRAITISANMHHL